MHKTRQGERKKKRPLLTKTFTYWAFNYWTFTYWKFIY